jgi:hypothetical protein
MNTISKWAMTLLFLLSSATYAQVPASNDTSDAHHNTGMGVGALGGPAASNAGFNNTAAGFNALYENTTGIRNTAVGMNALFNNTTGYNNTASGQAALFNNTIGNSNTAVGYGALVANTTGYYNTASGASALESNVTASYNTAVGYEALNLNDSSGAGAAAYNTAIGSQALYSNTDGTQNTASGYQALYSNTDGTQNTASGYQALYSNTTGYYNTASGLDALYFNTFGAENTASGYSALLFNTTGSNNIAMGYEAGLNVTTGSDNIDIGNKGESTDGSAANSGVIRIGTAGSQKEVFIAGIESSKITGSAVYVTTGGRLGVLASSERYKTDIASMGSNTTKLDQLRPVTFKLKTDSDGTLQYGLIAEEVAKVYPELVIRDEHGRIDGVRYDELAPMLLNELQKQRSAAVAQHEADAMKMDAQAARIASLERKVAEVDDLKQQLSAVVQDLKVRDELVAQR